MDKKELMGILTKCYIGAPVKGCAFSVVSEHCNVLQTESADHTDIIHIILFLDKESTSCGARTIQKIDVAKSKGEKYTAEDLTAIRSAMNKVLGGEPGEE